MDEPVDTAAVRLDLARLIADAQQGVAPDVDLAVRVADGVAEIARELETRRHRPATLRLIERVRKLEAQLADHEPQERVAIVRQRLGIGRTAYFRLRKLASASAGGLSSD